MPNTKLRLLYVFVREPERRRHGGIVHVARQIPRWPGHAYQRHSKVVPEHSRLDGGQENAKRHGQAAGSP
jgi:hypothetical protein